MPRVFLGTTRVPSPVTDDQVMKSAKQQELNTVLTILYVMVESGRQQVTEKKGNTVRQSIGRQIVDNCPNVANRIESQLL